MTDKVRLELDGPIAVITNDNPEKHNAFDDEMDLRLFEILGELADRADVRAVVWRAEGKSFSSGRDVAAIGGQQVAMTHHQLGQPAEARRWLDHATHALDHTAVEQPLPGATTGALLTWEQRLELRLLRQEATALLGGAVP